MFDLKIISKERLIFQEAVESVRVEGETTDFELMSFHADVAGLLRQGRIIINNKLSVNIARGLISFHGNRCIILADEDRRQRRKRRK